MLLKAAGLWRAGVIFSASLPPTHTATCGSMWHHVAPLFSPRDITLSHPACPRGRCGEGRGRRDRRRGRWEEARSPHPRSRRTRSRCQLWRGYVGETLAPHDAKARRLLRTRDSAGGLAVPLSPQNEPRWGRPRPRNARIMSEGTLGVPRARSGALCGDRHGQRWPDADARASSYRANTPDPSGPHARTGGGVIHCILDEVPTLRTEWRCLLQTSQSCWHTHRRDERGSGRGEGATACGLLAASATHCAFVEEGDYRVCPA
jgi:hypothetical protein